MPVGIQSSFRVTPTTYDVLQELQVILGIDANDMPARALESTLIWYDDLTTSGDSLRFIPPEDRPGWYEYTRSLAIDPSTQSTSEWTKLMVDEGPARERLKASDGLLGLTTVGGLEQMVRLRAEVAFREADGWTIVNLRNSEEAAR